MPRILCRAPGSSMRRAAIRSFPGGTASSRSSATPRVGFIVRGNRVRGTNATCSLVSSKKKGDVLTALLNCADKMIFETVSMSVRFESDARLVRFDPEFPEVQTAYKRCSR